MRKHRRTMLRKEKAPLTATLAAAVLQAPQRLRQGEAMTATTVALHYAARWQAAKEVRR